MKRYEFDVGHVVICDLCNADYTDSGAMGGLLFGGYAVCPICAPGIEADARKQGEEGAISDRCPPGVTFREWCLRLRGGPGNDKIVILTGTREDAMAVLDARRPKGGAAS